MTNPTESLVARAADETLARLAEHHKLKWMTPSKITGETYQMVPLELLIDADILIRTQAERLSTLEAALRPFAGERLPSTKRTRIDYDRHGLRRIISPMELAVKAAVLALSNEAGK